MTIPVTTVNAVDVITSNVIISFKQKNDYVFLNDMFLCYLLAESFINFFLL